MTIVLLLSAFLLLGYFVVGCSLFGLDCVYIFYVGYYVLVMICLIFLVARYRNVFCILVALFRTV